MPIQPSSGSGDTLTTMKKPKPKLQKLSRANSESNVQSKSISFNGSAIPATNSSKPAERRSSLGGGGIRSLRNKFQALSGGGGGSNSGSNKKSPPSNSSVPLPLLSTTVRSSKIGDGATVVPTTSKGPGPMIWKEGVGWGGGTGENGTNSSRSSSVMVRGWSDPISDRSRSSYADSAVDPQQHGGMATTSHRPSLDSVMAANLKLQQQQQFAPRNNSFLPNPTPSPSPPTASTSALTPLSIPRPYSSSTSPWAKQHQPTPIASTSSPTNTTSTTPIARRYSKDFERSSTEPPLSQLRAVRRGSIPRKPVPATDLPIPVPDRASSRISASFNNHSPTITSPNQTTTAAGAARFGYTRRSSTSSSPTITTPPGLSRTMDPSKKDDLAYRRLSLTSAPAPSSSAERRTSNSYRMSQTLEEAPEEVNRRRPSREEKGKGPEVVKNRVAMYQQKEVEWTKTPKIQSNSIAEESDLETPTTAGSLWSKHRQWRAPESNSIPAFDHRVVPEEEEEEEEEEDEEEKEEEDTRSVLDSAQSFRSDATTPEPPSRTSTRWPIQQQSTRPDSNFSRRTFGSPGGPQEFATPPASPPPPPQPLLSPLYTKATPLTPPRSIRRTHSGTSSLDNSSFRGLGIGMKGETRSPDQPSRHSTIGSSLLKRRATDGKNWSGSHTFAEEQEENRLLRSSQMQILRSHQSTNTVGWSEPYLAEVESETHSRVGEYLTPSAERFAKEESRRQLKESPLDDLINGLGGRRASEGTLRLDSSLGHSTMIGFYAGNHEAEDGYNHVDEAISPTFISNTIQPGSQRATSRSASTYHVDPNAVTPGYTRALSVEEMEAEIERMESELSHSRSNRRLLSTFDTSSSLAYSSNDLATSTSTSDSPFTFSSPFTPNHRQHPNANHFLQQPQKETSPHSMFQDDELTPQTARRWSIVEVELAYERMKGMLGSTRSLGLSERASEDDIAGAFDRAIRGSTRNRDSSEASGTPRVRGEEDELEVLEGERGPRSENVERSDSISSDSTLLQTFGGRQQSYPPSPIASTYVGRRHTDEDISVSPTQFNNVNRRNSESKSSPTMVRRSPSSRSLNILLHQQPNSGGTFNAQDTSRFGFKRGESLSPTFTAAAGRELGRKDSIETRRSSLSASNGSRSRIPLVRNLTRDSTISTTYDTASEGGWGTPINGTDNDSNSARSDSQNGEGANWLGDQSSATIREDLNRSTGSTNSNTYRSYPRASESPIDRFNQPPRRKSIPVRLSNSNLSQSIHPDSPTLDFLSTLDDDDEEEGEQVEVHLSAPRKISVATIRSVSSGSGEGNTTAGSLRMEDIKGMKDSELFDRFNSLEMERDAYLMALERTKKSPKQVALELKELESTQRRQKNFSDVLGVEPEAQVERLDALVQSKKMWEQKAQQALEELEHAKEDTNALKKALLQGLQREEDLERESVTLGAKLVAFAAQHGVLTPEPGAGRNGTFKEPESPTTTGTRNGYPFPVGDGTSRRPIKSPPRNPLRPISRSLLMGPLPMLPPSSSPTTPTHNEEDGPSSPSSRLALAFRGALPQGESSRPSSILSYGSTGGGREGGGESLGGGDSDGLGASLMAQEAPPNFNLLQSSYGSTASRLQFGRGPPPSPPSAMLRPKRDARRDFSGTSVLSNASSSTSSVEYSALDRRPGASRFKESTFLSDLSTEF